MTNPTVAALIARSNRLGSDPKNTNYAGGNTSAKGTETDPVTGEPVELLWVKGSGGDLGTLAESGLAVRRGGEGDAAVGMEVVDVRRPDQRVHRGVDARRRSSAPVQAEVEGGHHLVLALDTGVDVHQRAEPVQPQHRQPAPAQRAEVAAGALDPQQLDRLGGDGVLRGPLRGGVAARVVGVAEV